MSTSTKPSTLSQSTTTYYPSGPSVHPTEPPSPVITDRNPNNNPQNDKAVQVRFDRNQKAHGR